MVLRGLTVIFTIGTIITIMVAAIHMTVFLLDLYIERNLSLNFFLFSEEIATTASVRTAPIDIFVFPILFSWRVMVIANTYRIINPPLKAMMTMIGAHAVPVLNIKLAEDIHLATRIVRTMIMGVFLFLVFLNVRTIKYLIIAI